MVVVANRIPVAAEYTAAFEERFQNRENLVDGMPGFVSYQLLRPQKANDPYVVLTYWESRTDFDNWIKSDAFRKGHAQSGSLPQEAFTGESKIEIHEVVQSTD